MSQWSNYMLKARARSNTSNENERERERQRDAKEKYMNWMRFHKSGQNIERANSEKREAKITYIICLYIFYRNVHFVFICQCWLFTMWRYDTYALKLHIFTTEIINKNGKKLRKELGYKHLTVHMIYTRMVLPSHYNMKNGFINILVVHLIQRKLYAVYLILLIILLIPLKAANCFFFIQICTQRERHHSTTAPAL